MTPTDEFDEVYKGEHPKDKPEVIVPLKTWHCDWDMWLLRTIKKLFKKGETQ